MRLRRSNAFNLTDRGERAMEDELLEKYGEFYCSRYVAKNQPWIRTIPFGEWVERQLTLRQGAAFARMGEASEEADLAGADGFADADFPLPEIA
ncbi:hypothetical protein [Gorillibacterium sp. CAU 1737]|uniref:hypothetical protein n=1 Tax=Gorillibacterium sp. CAU 1737 TaxID=3140362 RepID=UPI003260F841